MLLILTIIFSFIMVSWPKATQNTTNIEAFEERAAIVQHDGGTSRRRAEDRAAREQGFADADAYWGWLTDYVLSRAVPS